MLKLKTIVYILALALVIFATETNAQGPSQTPQGFKDGPLVKVGTGLAEVYQQYQDAQLSGVAFRANTPAISATSETIVIEAVATNNVAQLQADLESLGLQNPSSAGHMVSGVLPISAIPDVAALDSLRFARPAYYLTRAGSVTSQGDATMNADIARANFGVDGSGVKIGILSDTARCLGTFEDDIDSGDLPTSSQVTQEGPCTPGTDEGRALMQLTHDTSPNTSMLFATAIGGQAAFATAIFALDFTYDADIIYDDIIYLPEPMFQDGIVAQAVDAAFNNGVAYFSSAGNEGRDAYESAYVNGEPSTILATGTSHDFDPGEAVNTRQSVTIPTGASVSISLQWDEPFASAGGTGATNDLDIFLLDSSNTVVASSANANVGGDAVEVLSFTNNTASNAFNLVIERDTTKGGSDPGLLKYVFFGSMIINEYDTNTPSLYGHANTDGAMAVGASFYATPTTLESFSSAGPTQILFDTDGNRLGTPITRNKPDIVGPDGVNTTFFGTDIPQDADNFPNFFGTSASVAHIAAVAALMLDANPNLEPASLYQLIRDSALDMNGAGFDFDSGYGFIQADLAVQNSFPADLELTKTGPSGILEAGETFDFVVAVTNIGSSASTNTVLTDILPSGLSFLSSLSTPASTCSDNSGTVTCQLGAIGSGQTATTTLTVKHSSSSNLTNTASVTSDNFDLDTSNNTDSASVTFIAPDLVLTKVVSKEVVTVGETIAYTIGVTNIGSSTSNNAILIDPIPSEISYVSSTSTTVSLCNFALGTVTCSLGNLAVGQSSTTTIVTTATSAGTANNTASVSSDETDMDISDNSDSESITIEAPPILPDLVITKTGSPNPVQVGQTLIYTIGVTNIGSSTSNNAILIDSIPSEIDYVSSTSTTGSPCDFPSGTVRCNLGNLAVGQSSTTTIVTTAKSAGTANNTASVSSDETDMNNTDNTDNESITIEAVVTSNPPSTSSGGSSGGGGRRRPSTPTETPEPIETPAPIPVPTEAPVILDAPPPPSPTPIPPGDLENRPIDEAVRIIEDAPLQDAVDSIEQITIEKKTEILAEADRQTAADIIEELQLTSTIEIVESMDSENLSEILPLVSPERLYEIPPTLLSEKFPNVSIEQLVGEIGPQPHPDLERPTSKQDSPTISTYFVTRTIQSQWAVLIGSPAPLDEVLGKFTNSLASIRVITEDILEPPPSVPKFPPDVVLNSMFTIDLPDSREEDLSVVHVTLFVEKDWVSDHDIHPWSIQFNRLNEESSTWVPFPTKRIREDDTRIYYSVGIPGFSLFALTGSTALPQQEFQVANLNITPESPEANEKITITASVTNLSDNAAIYPASLFIDSTLEDAEPLALDAGETALISFTTSRPEGQYRIRLDRLFGEIQVAARTEEFVLLASTATLAPISAIEITPTPTPTPRPTATPQPTATPVPTTTPMATATLTPTATQVVVAASLEPTATVEPQAIEASAQQPGESSNRRPIIVIAGFGIVGSIAIIGYIIYSRRRRLTADTANPNAE